MFRANCGERGSCMLWQHLSSDLIRAFAYRLAVMQPHELHHLQDCDDCSHLWWQLKKRAKCESGANKTSLDWEQPISAPTEGKSKTSDAA